MPALVTPTPRRPRRYRRTPGTAAVEAAAGGSVQVSGEEPVPGVPLELRNPGMASHVGVQRLLLGTEGVEQIEGHLPVVSFVVPLQQDLQRNGDLPRLVENGAGHVTPGEQNGG